MELHNSITGLHLHNDLQGSMDVYALQLNYMKLHDYGALSLLTFNIVMWLNTTGKKNALALIPDILDQ